MTGRPEKSDPRNGQWTKLTDACHLILRDKMAQMLDKVAAQHGYPGSEPRLVVCHAEIPGFLNGTPVTQRHVKNLGLRGQLAFEPARILTGELGFDLEALLDHLFSDVKGDESVQQEKIRRTVAELAPEQAYRQFMKTTDETYIRHNLKEIVLALRKDNRPESLQAALYLNDVAVCRASELQQKFPVAFEEVVKPLLGPAQEFIKPLTPLHEPQLARKFQEKLDPLKREADAICGWGAFLPCSLESGEFMEAHHRALCERLAGTSGEPIDGYVESYNAVGAANAKGTLLALEANRTFRFLHVLERRTVRQIAHGEGDFRFATAKDRASLRAHLLSLAERHNKQVTIAVIDDRHEGLLEKRHPGIESTWFLVKGTAALAAIERKLDGTVVITRTPAKAQEKLDRMMGATVGANYLDINDFNNLIEREEAVPH